MIRLSIVVPAYNEEDRIADFIQAYGTYFTEHYGDECEFIVVPNHCSDGTADVVRDHAAELPNLNLIVEEQKVGKGGALMIGMNAAKGELIGFVDADGATPPEAFDDLTRNLGQNGIIIASRWMSASKIGVAQPASRRIASRIFNGLVRFMFGLNIHDTQCGAKVMRKDVLEKVLPNIGTTRWAFDVDLLFQVRRSGNSIAEIPTEWNDVSGSRVRVVSASLDMMIALIRLRLYYSPFQRLVPKLDKIVGPVFRWDPEQGAEHNKRS